MSSILNYKQALIIRDGHNTFKERKCDSHPVPEGDKLKAVLTVIRARDSISKAKLIDMVDFSRGSVENAIRHLERVGKIIIKGKRNQVYRSVKNAG